MAPTNPKKISEFEHIFTSKKECIDKREAITQDEMVNTYDEWVEKNTYESDMEARSYYGPQLTADTAALMFPEGRDNVRIVDMAAGTGLIAAGMRKHGFKHIDAVDPCSAAKKVAMERGLYENYILDFVDDRRLDIKTDNYDGLVCAGAFTPGLMPSIALREFVRVVKPGGYVCFCAPEFIIRLSKDHRDNFEPLMEKYVQEGAWENVLRTVIPCYFDHKPGLLYVFKVLKSEVEP